MEQDAVGHVPVLMQQMLSYLPPPEVEDTVIVDCTAGRGGHALAIGQRLNAEGRLIALDADAGNAAFARHRLAEARLACRVDVEHANFVELAEVLRRLGVERFDGLLADLGFASNQVDDPGRGLSFRGHRGDGPLDMRLNPEEGPTAAELVNTLPERELADVIYRYGEERLSRRIARKIVERRSREPIESTSALAELVRGCYPPAQRGPRARIDPATRTFQALRIAVNDELGALERLLAMLPACSADGAVAVIISFHSLEDRLVKHAFAGWERDGLGHRLTRKPVEADEQECADNPRARSAKLRAFAFAEPR